MYAACKARHGPKEIDGNQRFHWSQPGGVCKIFHMKMEQPVLFSPPQRLRRLVPATSFQLPRHISLSLRTSTPCHGPVPASQRKKRFGTCLNCSFRVDSESLKSMSAAHQSDSLDQSSLPLAEQVVRLQALLEASRSVHSTIELTDVLQQSARIAVRELELDGALFTLQNVVYGDVPAHALTQSGDDSPRFELLSRDGRVLSEL